VSRRGGTAAASDQARPQAPADREAERGRVELAAEIRRLRQQLSPDALSDPRIRAELAELDRQVASALDHSRGRHRLPAGAAAPSVALGPVRDADGYNLKPDPLQAQTAAELVRALRQYRAWSGNTPFRQMAAQARQRVAHSTMCVALKSEELPGLKVLLAIVAGCGGSQSDQQKFATSWRRINDRSLTGPGPGRTAQPGPDPGAVPAAAKGTGPSLRVVR
jgi:hypothetical protein